MPHWPGHKVPQRSAAFPPRVLVVPPRRGGGGLCVMLLSVFPYRHGPGHPMMVWQDQKHAKRTISASNSGLWGPLLRVGAYKL